MSKNVGSGTMGIFGVKKCGNWTFKILCHLPTKQLHKYYSVFYDMILNYYIKVIVYFGDTKLHV